MKRTAGFLKILATIAVVLEVIALVVLLMVVAALVISGSLSGLSQSAALSVSYHGTNLTPEQIKELLPIILFALFLGLVCVVFALLGTINMRKALDECRNETPFSDRSVNSLKTSARMEIIGGLLGIVGGIVISLMASSLKINGNSAGNTMTSVNLSFLVYACGKYLLYHIAEYGRELENR